MMHATLRTCTADVFPDNLLSRLIANHHERNGTRMSEFDTFSISMQLPDLCNELLYVRMLLRSAGCEPQEIVSDALLGRLARGPTPHYSAKMTEEDQIMLSTRLKTICTELLEARTLVRQRFS